MVNRSGTDTPTFGQEFQSLPISEWQAIETLLKDLAGFPIPGDSEHERGENALLMLTEYQQRARRLLTPVRGEHGDETA